MNNDEVVAFMNLVKEMTTANQAIATAIVRDGAGMNPMGKGSLKLDKLNQRNATVWMAWKKKFKSAATINQWPEERAKAELLMSMRDEALTLTSNANTEGLTVQQILVIYDNLFMPMAQREVARAELRAMKQLTKETIHDYFNRICMTYRNAYPDETDAQMAESVTCRDAFMYGVRDRTMRLLMRVQKPLNLQEAYQNALTLYAGRDAETRQGGSSESQTSTPMQIGAVRKEGFGLKQEKVVEKRSCFYCRKEGHLSRDCKKRTEDLRRPSGRKTLKPRRRFPERGSDKKKMVRALKESSDDEEEPNQGN